MNSFLDDVLGECAAPCRDSAALIKGLPPTWLPMRACLAWVRSGDYSGPLPGGTGEAVLRKTAAGYEGEVRAGGEQYVLRGAEDLQVAALVAALVGLEPIGKIEVAPLKLARFGATLEAMAKSHNAKMQRRYEGGDPAKGKLSPEKVDARRQMYARSLGLVPVAGLRGKFRNKFPVQHGNQVHYDENFSLPHEIGHAMHAGSDTIHQHNEDIAAPESDDSPEGEKDEGWDNGEGQNEEDAIATSLEHKIDRRSGVDPNLFPTNFRNEIGDIDSNRLRPWKPTELGMTWKDRDYDTGSFPRDDQKDRTAAAAKIISDFDAGARFSANGKIVPPTGLDARISAAIPRPKKTASISIARGQTEMPWGPETSSPKPRPTHKGEMGGFAKPIAPIQDGKPQPAMGPKQPRAKVSADDSKIGTKA